MARPADALATALTYTRVSMDEMAKEGLSLAAQLAECRRYAAQRGWVLGAEYQDVMKGTRDDRPDYQRLLADVRAMRATGQRVVVVVAALVRFGRKLLERVRSREELKALGVAVHSVREGGEVSDLVANILASVAQEEVRRLGERVSPVIQHTRGGGWYFPGKVPLGYRLREATGEERRTGAPRTVLDVDEERAPYVREAFQRAASGRSAGSVSRWLLGLPASVRDGRSFGPTAVLKLLTNPVYAARPRSGDADVLSRSPGRWPPLVDDHTFRRVLEGIASHARIPRSGRRARDPYLLTGLLRCPRCGLSMSGSGTPGQARRYRCPAYLHGASAPDPSCTVTAGAEALDAAVLAEVVPLVDRAVSEDRRFQAALRKAWQRLTSGQRVDDSAERARVLERQADKHRGRLREAARLLVDGDLDREGYEMLRDEVRGELEAAEVELARLRQQTPVAVLPDLDTVLAEAGSWYTAIHGTDPAERRDILGELIERVEPVRLAPRQYAANITCTPAAEILRASVEAAALVAQAA